MLHLGTGDVGEILTFEQKNPCQLKPENDGVCFQKVVDKSGMKLREGFRPHILPSQYSRKS